MWFFSGHSGFRPPLINDRPDISEIYFERGVKTQIFTLLSQRKQTGIQKKNCYGENVLVFTHLPYVLIELFFGKLGFGINILNVPFRFGIHFGIQLLIN